MKKTRQKNLRLKNKKDQSRTIFFCLIFFWLMAATIRLKSLCVTRGEQEEVDQLIQKWSGEIPIRFTLYEDEWGRAEVAHYEMRSLSAFKNKIAQFPTGTVFKWKSFNEGPLDEDEEKRFRKLESILAEQGARIVK